jgi:hypothetical protein
MQQIVLSEAGNAISNFATFKRCGKSGTIGSVSLKYPMGIVFRSIASAISVPDNHPIMTLARNRQSRDNLLHGRPSCIPRLLSPKEAFVRVFYGDLDGVQAREGCFKLAVVAHGLAAVDWRRKDAQGGLASEGLLGLAKVVHQKTPGNARFHLSCNPIGRAEVAQLVLPPFD